MLSNLLEFLAIFFFQHEFSSKLFAYKNKADCPKSRAPRKQRLTDRQRANRAAFRVACTRLKVKKRPLFRCASASDHERNATLKSYLVGSDNEQDALQEKHLIVHGQT